MQLQKDEYLLSDDKSLLNVDAIHELLVNAYWAGQRSKEIIAKSIVTTQVP